MLPELSRMKNTSDSKPSFLADENIPLKFIKEFSNIGFDIKRVELRKKDKQVFEIAKSVGRVLLTSDKHFLNKLKFPPQESSGIIFLKIHPPLIDSIQFSLDKLLKSVNSSEFKGRLFIVSLTGFKVWPRS